MKPKKQTAKDIFKSDTMRQYFAELGKRGTGASKRRTPEFYFNTEITECTEDPSQK